MKRLDIDDNTSISMPIRNMIAIIGAICLGVWAYFGVTEKLNQHSTTLQLIDKEIKSNSEFRIRYPRGDLGQSQNDLEQFMLIEELYKSVEKMEKVLESNMTNKVNIDFLTKQVEKMLRDIEKLKDKQREFANGDH